MWIEDIPPHIGVLVGISGSDQVSCAPALLEYANRCRVQREDLARARAASGGSSSPQPVAPVLPVYWPGYSHGQALVVPSTQHALYKALSQNEQAIL